jgi:hypothetical protein
MNAGTTGPQGPRDGAAVPAGSGRRVLDGVPGFRYILDGFNPFALCLGSCLKYLGFPRPYGELVACSGAAFRMAWNHTGWDEGNMDLSRLGPEPFRRGVQCAGYRPRFLVKPDWWRESKYQDNDLDREALQALVQHCFDCLGVPAVITHNADHEPQLAPLRALGFTNKDPKERGTLVITEEEWER